MAPHTVSPDTVEELKRAAIARAEQLGHHMQMFRTAKQDPEFYVSFCDECRQMVLLNVAARPDGDRALFGYALEAPCLAHPSTPGAGTERSR